MRLNQLQLTRFKRFKDFTLQFSRPIGNSDITLLIGDNGSGKTSILQAIAATLGDATRQLNSPDELNWGGFVPGSLSANYRGNSEVRLDIEFSREEISATSDFYHRSDYPTFPNATAPADAEEITLIWESLPNENKRSENVITDPRGASYYFQFQGRRYAYNLLYNRSQNSDEDLFGQIGGVFWYTEDRKAYTLAPFTDEGHKNNGKNPIQQIDSETALRNLFIRWFAFANSGKNNKLNTFNTYYSRLFPRRKLDRIEDMYGAEPSVYFSDGENDYDISEISAGERAIMPVLVDFVEWGIHNSVILIDELELHLHPPIQQALISLLPKLGKNNQFIITTHSDAVATIVPEANIQRMEIS